MSTHQVSVKQQPHSAEPALLKKPCPFHGCYSHSSGGHQLAQSSSVIKNLTAFGLNSSLWKNPPVIIFLLNVTTSAGSSRPQCSCAQNFPVQPPPVCTSSTRKAQPCCRDRRRSRNVSPPSQTRNTSLSEHTNTTQSQATPLLPLPSLPQPPLLNPPPMHSCVRFHS